MYILMGPGTKKWKQELSLLIITPKGLSLLSTWGIGSSRSWNSDFSRFRGPDFKRGNTSTRDNAKILLNYKLWLLWHSMVIVPRDKQVKRGINILAVIINPNHWKEAVA